ncbi:MAG: low molecular weight phosphotyrosine protein phosphatase [Proteobacteria bacterium]|uniref:low molecular weight protein-tyrosine-phosphatase n=1 Tax=Aquabacterium sp. TaxID=1872578 RepID=UPI0035C77346|nr:low molecular weight phosphotyrosine protein phosphatase [Pseudomonadota bacterium]
MSSILSRWLGQPDRTGSDDAAAAPPRLRVLMVCMGNICRSPTAEAVLRAHLVQAGLDQDVAVDSAGTHAYHLGSPPDARSREAGQQRGYALGHLRARKVQPQDYADFDLLLAMDWDNLALLEEGCPSDLRPRLRRLTEFIPADHALAGAPVVPDPYYGGPAGFEHVLDLIEAASQGLVPHLQARLAGLPPRASSSAPD